MELNELSLKARRSTRIALRVPVKISTRDSDEPFDAQTTIINKHGARFACEQCVNSMQEVVITTNIGEIAIGQVVWASTRPNSDGNFEFAVELNEPTCLFGVSFPPKDWDNLELAECLERFMYPLST